MATVRIPALLQPLTGGVGTIHAAGSTLREVLADTVRQHPDLANRIADATGILPEIMIAVDNTETSVMDTPVGEGSEVLVLPAIQGGGPISDFGFWISD